MLQGGVGSDSLEGGAGGDSLDGGSEADTASYASSSLGVTVDLRLGANPQVSAGDAAGDRLTSIENLTGSALADILSGDGNGNVLSGLGGDDTLTGFLGDDTYVVDSAGDRVVDTAGEGTDRVLAVASYTLAAGQEIEVLATTGAATSGAIDLSGNGFGQSIFGNADANVLNGAGTDVMRGGAGNDYYVVDEAEDVVVEGMNSGQDKVLASVSYGLANNQHVEILAPTSIAGTGSIDLTGNNLNNTVAGNAGRNELGGGGGNDRLSGYDGEDTLLGGEGDDLLDGGAGADVMRGGAGDDTYLADVVGDNVFEAAGGGTDRVLASGDFTLSSGQEVEFLRAAGKGSATATSLVGNAFNQTVLGNAGANHLDGKEGVDRLVGYDGEDTFAFSTVIGTASRDLVYDFSHADDTIELSAAVFTVLNAGPLASSAFKVLGDPGVGLDDSDRVIYNEDTGALFYDRDGGGRTYTAICFAKLTTTPTDIDHTDFVVVA